MSKHTVTIEAEVILMPAVVAFTCNPGDQIMVLNGVAIGLFNGTQPTQRVALTRHSQPEPEPTLMNAAVSAAKPRYTRKQHIKFTASEIKQRVIELLRMRGAMDSLEINDLLGFPRGSLDRGRTNKLIRGLAETNTITGSGSTGRKARLIWRLVDGAPAAS